MTTAMAREAREAPLAIARALSLSQGNLRAFAQDLQRSPPSLVVTCARGSSDHAASFFRSLVETRLGIISASLSPSNVSLYKAPLQLKGALFIAISQSGQSPDIVEATSVARIAGARCLAFVNEVNSPLAQAAGQVIPLGAGPEVSVAATKSCLCAMALVFALVAYWRSETTMEAASAGMAEAVAAAQHLDWSSFPAFLARSGPLFAIGRGPGLAVAAEAALKLKETCALGAEAISGAEVFHGPLALASQPLRALVFAANDEARWGLLDTASRLKAAGVDVRTAGSELDLPLAAGLDPAVELLALLQRFYLACEEASRLVGRDPDAPPFLNKVTRTV